MTQARLIVRYRNAGWRIFRRPSKIQAFAKKPESERPHIVDTAIARGNLYGPGAADQVLERTHLG